MLYEVITLVDGVKAVRIQGEPVKVNARIRRIDDYSGHADGPELARWIASRRITSYNVCYTKLLRNCA